MWAATAWWWPMAVVWVVSRRRLDFFGVCLSVSALVDLRFLSPSYWRYLHRRVGPLPAAALHSSRARQQDRTRLAPGSRTELVSRPAAGPSSSRARQQDRARLTPGSRTELVSRPAAGPTSSRARQQDRARLAPGSRTELVSRPAAGPDSSRARQQDLTRLAPGGRTGRWWPVLAGLLGLDPGDCSGVRKAVPFHSSLWLG